MSTACNHAKALKVYCTKSIGVLFPSADVHDVLKIGDECVPGQECFPEKDKTGFHVSLLMVSSVMSAAGGHLHIHIRMPECQGEATVRQEAVIRGDDAIPHSRQGRQMQHCFRHSYA